MSLQENYRCVSGEGEGLKLGVRSFLIIPSTPIILSTPKILNTPIIPSTPKIPNTPIIPINNKKNILC